MKKILIVDDEPTILMTMSHVLSSKESMVITSSRIEEAEEAIARYTFDLVIADIRLSGMDGIEGLELLSYVKQRSPKTEVIIMTAYGSDELREEAYRRGAFYYFEKPIDIPQLIEKAQSIGIETMAKV
ncbi:MAG TPA: response regulator [Thermodesulfovibrionales bacterium]|nr:response regulator [Thermodesulfovibrionales bacterium]